MAVEADETKEWMVTHGMVALATPGRTTTTLGKEATLGATTGMAVTGGRAETTEASGTAVETNDVKPLSGKVVATAAAVATEEDMQLCLHSCPG